MVCIRFDTVWGLKSMDPSLLWLRKESEVGTRKLSFTKTYMNRNPALKSSVVFPFFKKEKETRAFPHELSQPDVVCDLNQ